MKKKKVILLGGLVLILALSIYVIALADLDVGNNLNMWPDDPEGIRYKIHKLGDPLGPQDAATWGYVKDAVGGLDPGSTGKVGIWRQTGDPYDIYLGSTVGLNVLSGNVGIGTNDPSAQLHIYNASGSADIRLQSSSTFDNSWSIYSTTTEMNDNLAFYSHNSAWDSERNANIITFAHSGGVGIGTTSPRQHLSIGNYLDIYDGAKDDDLEYSSIRASIENLTINGSDIHGGVYINHDRGRGVKFFAHPDENTTIEIANLNDAGDLRLGGTLNVDSGFSATDKSYVYGKLGVGKILNPTASLDVIADIGVSDIFKVSHLASVDFVTEVLRPSGDVDISDFTKTCDSPHPSCSFHWQAVDEVSSDGDTSYIKGAVGEREAIKALFNIPSLTGPVYSVDYVKVIVVCKSDQTTNPAFASPVLRVGGAGSIYTNDTFTELDGNYQTITFTTNQNPADDEAWENTDIDGLQIGVQARGGVEPTGQPQYPESFIASTQILMADGGYKSIEEIKAGDKVVSYDLDNQLFVDNEVISTTNGNKGYLLINDKLGITLNQKVYVVDKGFIQAQEVSVGDYLLNESKENVRVNSIKDYSGEVDVYDLVLKSPHNFFAEGYLVHNLIGVQSGVMCTQVYAQVGYSKTEPTTAFVVDDQGYVGIGTINPYAKLNVFDGNVYLSDNESGTTSFGTVDVSGIGNKNINLEIVAAGTGYITILSNVGIGSSTADYQLDVAGTSRFTQSVIVAVPENSNHAATKGYVDTAVVPEWSTSIQIGGTKSDACDAETAGSLHYYTASDVSYFQVCIQNGASSYIWDTLKTYDFGAE